MVIWLIMKPIMHLCIKDLESVEIDIFWSYTHVTEVNITFKKSSLRDWQIESTQLTYECWSYHATSLIRVCPSDYLENVLFGNMTISNKFSVIVKSIMTAIHFFLQKKEMKVSQLFLKINHVHVKNFAIVN